MNFTPKEREAYQVSRGRERHQQAGKSAEKVFGFSDLIKLANEAGLEMDLSQQKPYVDDEQELIVAEERNALKADATARLNKFLRTYHKLLGLKKDAEEKLQILIRNAHSAGEQTRESARVWVQISALEKIPDLIQAKLEEEAQKSPEAYKAYWLKCLRKMKKDYDRTGIVETPAIEAQTKHLMADVRRKLEHTNGVVTLLGPTGSGKTVLATRLARDASPDGKFEFVSANSKMLPQDLLFRMGITAESVEPKDVPGLIEKAQNAYRTENSDADEETLEANDQIIAEVITTRSATPKMVTTRVLEAVGRAAQEGRIVVIDEFNYLPPETLGSINHLLSENKETKPGFGVIFTGNVGAEYLKRQKLDPAFVNRILSGVVEYSYPPQEIDKSLDQAILEREDKEKNPPERDLFMVGVVHLIDTKGNLEAPESALRDTWKLAQTFSLIEQLAAGKDFRSLGLTNQANAGVTSFKFESVFLSFRNFNQIVREWKLEGYSRPLDWYIFNNIIRPAHAIAPKEAAQLLYLFKDHAGFFAGNSWGTLEVDPSNWRVSGTDTIKAPKKSSVPLKQFLPDELVEAVSGVKVPGYEDVSDEGVERQKTEEKEREMALAETEVNNAEKAMEKAMLSDWLEVYAEICPLST